jgi:hypothetical protein
LLQGFSEGKAACKQQLHPSHALRLTITTSLTLEVLSAGPHSIVYNGTSNSHRTVMLLMTMSQRTMGTLLVPRAAPARLSQPVSSVAALPHQTGGRQLAAGRVIHNQPLQCTLLIHNCSSASFVSHASLLLQQPVTGCQSLSRHHPSTTSNPPRMSTCIAEIQ